MIKCLVLKKLWLDSLHHLQKKTRKRVYCAVIGVGRGQWKKNLTILKCGYVWWWDVDGHILMQTFENK
jgi:hypothetical protein